MIMNELKTYSLTGFALIVSSTNIIPALQIISLLLACVYTIIQIKNKL